jgi:hypothetical protein
LADKSETCFVPKLVRLVSAKSSNSTQGCEAGDEGQLAGVLSHRAGSTQIGDEHFFRLSLAARRPKTGHDGVFAHVSRAIAAHAGAGGDLNPKFGIDLPFSVKECLKNDRGRSKSGHEPCQESSIGSETWPGLESDPLD